MTNLEKRDRCRHGYARLACPDCQKGKRKPQYVIDAAKRAAEERRKIKQMRDQGTDPFAPLPGKGK